jgi:hypothetical protein
VPKGTALHRGAQNAGITPSLYLIVVPKSTALHRGVDNVTIIGVELALRSRSRFINLDTGQADRADAFELHCSCTGLALKLH